MTRESITTSTTTRPDPRLLALARAGDRAAIATLVRDIRPFAARIAFAALHNADDAQDVAQESLVYAISRLGQLRDSRQFLSWLRAIVLSQAVDYRRRRATRRLGVPLDTFDRATEETNLTQRLALRELLAPLSPAQRIVVELHLVDGRTIDETATLLQIPADTVRSRLRLARARLRSLDNSLQTSGTTMPIPSPVFQTLPGNAHNLFLSTFPGATIETVQEQIEPWSPFSHRTTFVTPDGGRRVVDVRRDISPDRAALLRVLTDLGLPVPEIVAGPLPDGGGFVTLTQPPVGENVNLWAMGGTPHRLRIATDRTFEGIDRLQGVTPALLATDAGKSLPVRTLAGEADRIVAAGGTWLDDPWFVESLRRVRAAAAEIHDPLVLTETQHFYPIFYRLRPETDDDSPLGWPGDLSLASNPLVSFTLPWGYIGDPLLGLSMVWLSDCYPFVHTGFVEQFLFRRGVSRRAFAPRVALKALQKLQEDTTPTDRSAYVDALRGWAEQSLPDL